MTHRHHAAVTGGVLRRRHRHPSSIGHVGVVTRWIAATFAIVAVADALHQGYAALKELS